MASDYTPWIGLGGIIITVGVVPLMRRIFTSVTRKEFQDYVKEFKDYLEKRDEVSDRRHTDNLDRFDRLIDDVADTRERLSRMEGSLSGSYRRI